MQHTYLRYECADSFGLISSSASSKAPVSNSILAFGSESRNRPVLLTTAGSHCMGFHLRTTEPTIKIGHREQLSGGVGTGRALNSDQIVCLDVAIPKHDESCKVATGWVDGAVRVFDVTEDEICSDRGCALAQTLLQDSDQEDFAMREPLVLNGHSGSPIRSLVFHSRDASRLASGSSDGSVVLWDIVAETGLFRLLGHKGGITDINFVVLNSGALDVLVTSSLDGLVKVWDLEGQCCIQTIPTHRGEVWSAACLTIPGSKTAGNESIGTDDNRIRLVTGSSDGQARVWSVQTPERYESKKEVREGKDLPFAGGDGLMESADDVCHYMGTLIPPPNVSTSSERIACVHFHPNGKYVGVLHANSKNVDVYLIRSTQESLRKKQRRLKRKKEKSKLATKHQEAGTKGQKRGILDDPDTEDENNEEMEKVSLDQKMSPEQTKASDEFEYLETARASHKVKGFIFVPYKEQGAGVRIVCALSTNALEIHSLIRKAASEGMSSVVNSNKVLTMNLLGHPTGIRGLDVSSDDSIACTVSKNSTKIWNIAKRSCTQSLTPSVENKSCYGLCAKFLPGNTHLVLGTREGHLLLLDISSGDVVDYEENAHDGAIWSIDLRRPSVQQPNVAFVTGSADKTVKFWEIEEQAESDTPALVHTRTLEMSDDVVAVKYSHSTDPTKRMVFVSSLDSTIKVFFDDTLKFFLSLYGHKLPALAIDAADDDSILASSGADKTIKIWGLDFGDTHRTLHGHQDSVTDLRFVKRSHNFFTTSKDGTVRFWDADRFEQILILNGHFAEVSCLAISRTGAFVLTGGMDRQVRVWERTKDMVFLEEERERELEQMFDRVDQDEQQTAKLLQRKDRESGEDEEAEDEPQSEAAVRKSILSVSAGDRIMEALERADQETKDAALFRKSTPRKDRMPNPLLLGKEPPLYLLWVLKTVKQAELEQSLLVLPLGHVERLLHYLIILLNRGRGIEICSRVSIFLVRIHQNQILTNRSMSVPLRELARLVRLRLAESRDEVGYNLAALRAVARNAASKKESFLDYNGDANKDIWAGLGVGSDLAAAAEGRRQAKT
eukprot:scaffold517_cov119-Cylindrotheca_fusiformis.AAC.33